MNRVAVWGVLIVLAGCNGGAAVDSGALEDEVDLVTINDPGTLPTAGRADYTGTMTARLPVPGIGTRAYIGDLALSVDFGADDDALTGRANRFAHASGDQLTGGLSLASGALFRSTDPDENYTFDGDVTGTLTHATGGAMRIDAQMSGDFRGTDQAAVQGVIFGDVTTRDGLDIFDGSFAGERD